MYYRFEVRRAANDPWEGCFQYLFPDQRRFLGRWTKMVSDPSVHQFPLLVYTGRLRKIRGFSGGSGEGTHGKFFRRRNADFETSETGKYRNAR